MSSTATSVHPPALRQLDDVGRALLFTDARTPNTFAKTLVSDAELSEIWDWAKRGSLGMNAEARPPNRSVSSRVN